MGQTFTVSAVSEHTNQWGNPPNGPFTEYKVKFQEKGDDVIAWSKKLSSPPPTVGEVVTGTLETTQFGTKFKREYENRNGAGGTSGSSKGDFRSKEQIIQQESDRTAAILCVANALAGKGFEFDDFLKRTAALETRTSRLALGYGAEASAPPAGGEGGFRLDFNKLPQTGQSDVPSNVDEFQQPTLPSAADESIPF